MADEPVVPEQVAAPAPEVAAPAAAPVVEAAAPVVEAPVVEAAVPEAPVVEAPAAEVAAPDAPKDLLKDATADGEKPADAPKPEGEVEKPADGEKSADAEKPADGEKPVEPEKPAEVEAAVPEAPQRLEALTEYKYEVPEEIRISDTQRETFHTAIEDARNGNPQALIDLHYEAMKEFRTGVEQNQRDAWATTLQDWQSQVENDPQIGGQKFGPVSQRVAQMRDNYVSTHPHGSDEWKAEMSSFNEMLDRTGVGNHPAMWRFLDNVAKKLNEPSAPTLTNPKPAPSGKRGTEVMYDNPRSPRANGAS